MKTTMKAPAQEAQRDLVRRLDIYLNCTENQGHVFGPWETDLLCRVIAHLATGNFRIGEDVMLHVERPDLYCSAKALATVEKGPTLTIAEVRAGVAQALAAVRERHPNVTADQVGDLIGGQPAESGNYRAGIREGRLGA